MWLELVSIALSALAVVMAFLARHWAHEAQRLAEQAESDARRGNPTYGRRL